MKEKKKPFDAKAYQREYQKKYRLKHKEGATTSEKIEEIKEKLSLVEEEPAPEPAPVEPQEAPAEAKPEPQEAPKPDEQANTSKSFFDALRSDYKQEEPEKKPEEQKPNEEKQNPVSDEIKIDKKIPNAETKTLITGYLFLLAVNSVYPDLLVWFLSLVSKKYRGMKTDNLSLDGEQLSMIEPIADEVVLLYLPKMNPALLLAVCMNAMYFQKIKEEIKTNPPPPQPPRRKKIKHKRIDPNKK